MRDKKVGLVAAISLLNYFSVSKPELSLSDISKLSGYPIANTSRYLHALETEGLVKRDERTKIYSLGFKILTLAGIVLDSISLHKVSLEYMNELRDLYNETICLHVVSGNLGVLVERLQGNRVISHNPKIGIPHSLNAGASRKVLLAFMSEERIQEIVSHELVRYTKKTITDPNLLLEELQRIKRKGYCISIGEVTPGAKSIAVPIFNNGSVIGSLSINGPEFRINRSNEKKIIIQLKNTSRNISEQLGSSPLSFKCGDEYT